MDSTQSQTGRQYSGSDDLWMDRNYYYNVTPPTFTGKMGLLIDPTMDKAVSVFTVIILWITMISLGCTMEVAKIKAHIRKPKEVAIALVAQFGIMPLAAFTLARVFQMGPMEALIILICGCCPGGSLSNVFTLALEGDMNLSIVMTTCSTVLSLGMMPLLLFLFCKGIPNAQKRLPYGRIVISLIMTLLPCLVGIAINHKAPHYSQIIKKIGFSLLLISVVVIGVISGIIVGDMIWLVLSIKMVVTALLMPMTGFLLGYFLSRAFKLNEGCRRTVAMETGCQNIQLCSTIFKVTFPIEIIGSLFLFPVLYIFSQCIEALLLVIIYRSYKSFQPAVPPVKYSPRENGNWELTTTERKKQEAELLKERFEKARTISEKPVYLPVEDKAEDVKINHV